MLFSIYCCNCQWSRTLVDEAKRFIRPGIHLQFNFDFADTKDDFKIASGDNEHNKNNRKMTLV